MVSRRLVYQNVSGVTLAINQVADVIDPATSDFYTSGYGNSTSSLKACVITGSYDGIVDGVAYMEQTWRDLPSLNLTVNLGNVLRHADLSYKFNVPALGYGPDTTASVTQYTSGGAVKFRFKVVDINGVTHYSDYKYVYVDYDGNVYNVLKYGTQLWTIEDYRGDLAFKNSWYKLSDIENYTIHYVRVKRATGTPIKHEYVYAPEGLASFAGMTTEDTYIARRNTFYISDFGFYVPSAQDVTTISTYFENNGVHPCDVTGVYNWQTSSVENSPGYNPTNNNSTNFDLYPVNNYCQDWNQYDSEYNFGNSANIVISHCYSGISLTSWWLMAVFYNADVFKSSPLYPNFISNVGRYGTIRFVSDVW